MEEMNGSNAVESEFVEVDPTGRYGRYNEILGKGSSKTVYKGFDEYEGIEVAWNQVKLHEFLQTPEDLERLYSEIHLLKKLKHSNIMKLYTSWIDTTNRNINFVTEMFTSGTLREFRQKHKRVNIRAVKHWCSQILRGLVYLHNHEPPIIHRDLKCDNIFVNGNQGQVKIGDLGLAAIVQKSHTNGCVGTPEFMAPEIYADEYNELVDIYAFGMCVLEMVTFEYPYSECIHPAQIYKKVISGKKPDALYKVKNPVVQRFVEKCLAAVSCRISARELLMDAFLQIPDDGDTMLRSFPLNCIGSEDNNLYCKMPNGESNEISLFASEYNENQGNASITITGTRREDDGIFLMIRMADIEGCARNIHFPFDTETDTALSVASEMVAELDMNKEDVTKIADMIDDEIISLIPEWKSRFHLDEHNNHHHNCSSNGRTNNTEFLQIHDLFEKGSNQCVTEGGPVGSTVPNHENGSFEEQRWDTKSKPNLTGCELLSEDQAKDHDKEIEQELRWLKAKYEMRLRELKDRKMGFSSKSWVVEYNNNGMKKDELNDETLIVNYFEPNKKWTRIYESGCGSCGPDMVAGKSFYGGTLLVPQTLHRATSLPVDAVDF